MRIGIEGIGVVGGFGTGIADLENTLFKRFQMPDTVSVGMVDRTEDFHAYLADITLISNYFSLRELRRVDHFSKMALLAAGLALEDASRLDHDHQDMAIVIATGYGAMKSTYALKDTIRSHGDQGASPTKFSSSVHNAAASHISILFNIHGPNYTISQFEMSVPSAVFTACRWLLEERVDSVLLGGIDEFCDVLGYCHRRFFGSKGEKGMQPLDFKINTAVPGEGAAFFLLTRSKGEDSRYGHIVDAWSGRIDHTRFHVPEDAVLILGADGHQECGLEYERLISLEMEKTCYTPLYGSLPIGPIFDMAIVALGMKSDRVFAAPKNMSHKPGDHIILQDQKLQSRKIVCLKVGSRREYGTITMVR